MKNKFTPHKFPMYFKDGHLFYVFESENRFSCISFLDKHYSSVSSVGSIEDFEDLGSFEPCEEKDFWDKYHYHAQLWEQKEKRVRYKLHD